MKSIATINPAIMENTECLIVRVRTSFTNLKVGVLLDHGVLLRFILLLAVRTCWKTFQAKNNISSTLASSSLTLVSHWSLNTYSANRHLHAKGERNGVPGRTKISGRAMMQALELLWLAKRHISGRSDVEQSRIQGCSYSYMYYRITLV